MTLSMVTSLGYQQLPDAVPQWRVRALRRLLYLEIRRRGLTAEEVAEWQSTTFYPWLRDIGEIGALFDYLRHAAGWQHGDALAEPQILIRLPDFDEPVQLQPHVDVEPPWAAGLTYRSIVGVALTTNGPGEGELVVWPGSHQTGSAEGIDPRSVLMVAGDAIVMHPKLLHAGSLNLGSDPRMAIYFRVLCKDAA